jgi:hypothetical protein
LAVIVSRAKSVEPMMIRRTVTARGRLVAMLCCTLAVLSINLVSVVAAGADAFWSNAIEMPGLSTLNQTTAATGPIVCTSSGNCVSGGAFTDGSHAQQAFLSVETNGVWSSATEVAAALNLGGVAGIIAISCPSAGDCTAEGTYTDGADVVHTFVLDQVNGSWGFATEVPDFTSMAAHDASEMTTLSCTSASTCVGVGSFVDHATSTAQPIIFDETDGVWDTPVEAPGAASLNPSGIAFVGGLDCVSATTCVAGGDIINLPPATGPLVPFLIDEDNGVWAPMEEVPGIAALSPLGEAGLTALSCGAPGDCAGGGVYLDASDNAQAYVINEVGGVWGSATELFATQELGSGVVSEVNSIACPSAGDCSAVGAYSDVAGNTQPFVVDETDHVWSRAIEIPGVQALNDNDGATLTTISCSVAGACSAGGDYTDADGNSQAFLVNEANHAWTDPIEVPGTSTLNKGGMATIYQVSCSGDGSCGVQGSYTDASQNTQLFVVNSQLVQSGRVPTALGAPRDVTATDKSGVVTVRWKAPLSTGGHTISSYTVVSRPRSTTCVSHAPVCVVRGLTKGVTYTFQVRATNRSGAGPFSKRSNTVRAS